MTQIFSTHSSYICLIFSSSFIFLNGQNPLFNSFHMINMAQIDYNDKSVDGVLETRTWHSRMVGAGKSTELWRHPSSNFIYTCDLYVYFCGFGLTKKSGDQLSNFYKLESAFIKWIQESSNHFSFAQNNRIGKCTN